MTDKLKALQGVIEEFDRRMVELKKNMVKEFEGTIKGVFTEVFNAHPELERISWTQYTPYFNDGDPCVFGVNGMYFLRTDDPEEMKEDNLYDWHDASWGDEAKEFPALVELSKLIHSSDDVLLMLFGDHCQVTVTRKGIDVEEYDHE